MHNGERAFDRKLRHPTRADEYSSSLPRNVAFRPFELFLEDVLTVAWEASKKLLEVSFNVCCNQCEREHPKHSQPRNSGECVGGR